MNKRIVLTLTALASLAGLEHAQSPALPRLAMVVIMTT